MSRVKKDPRQSLQIDPVVHGVFKSVCKTRAVGRSVSNTATRLLMWFSVQPQHVQTAVVNDVDGAMREQYAVALDALAKQLRDGSANPPRMQDFQKLVKVESEPIETNQEQIDRLPRTPLRGRRLSKDQ